MKTKKLFSRYWLFVVLISSFFVTNCEDDDKVNPTEELDGSRWVTVAGALMGDNPGDGNGGTMIYAVSYEDAIDPATTINLYDNGEPVKSNRTARLQVSEDGNTMFNIAYAGENGGEFSRFGVQGGANYVEEDVTVSIAQYAGTAPRWGKLYDGDKTGIAVNIANIAANNTNSEEPFKYYRGTATVLALDLQNVLISNYKQYEIALSEQEEAEGHAIFRLDAPVLNQAGNKLLIGTWMRKYDPATGDSESEWERLGTKTVVVDYPSLENPKVITSTVAFGDCSGYRSNVNFLAEDGSIYQATQRDPNGSHILKITTNNEYDNSYVFSLDQALGVENVYVQTWRYVKDNIGYIVYQYGDSDQSYVARVDLNNRTAEKVMDIPNDADLDLFQYQGFLAYGDYLLMAITPVGKDGNIYVFNSQTGEVTKGATLANKPGNHYIGVF
ncbi:hypothetical protein EV198_1503 [Roseivirga ehrenbergii]|uniref:DUF4374 domain-containing protein n=1 Tax=Roseivirga ehrenbergii (strain DSM 102268 / JCM 13514 / KCTC 12282 / NCIMB 14502 / KMM 6017) TaxID=279360 RepID=A0A150XIJ9_ROSEK|nr:hypothetical protein [Roseivirga ehrenbergii]KYG78558.1 hypothetical protein MB14_17660 [Roseivirga ehrenbergii]TCL10473.1 hypothetical protein EV198_1503 [Roseivirga ehrenbergii]